MINILRALIEKVDNRQQHTSNIIREINFLRKNQKKTPGMKNTVAEMKNAFTGPLVHSTGWGKNSELEDKAIETSKLNANGHRIKNWNTRCKNDTVSKHVTCITGISEEER